MIFTNCIHGEDTYVTADDSRVLHTKNASPRMKEAMALIDAARPSEYQLTWTIDGVGERYFNDYYLDKEWS